MMPPDLSVEQRRVVKKSARLRNEANTFTMRFTNDLEGIRPWKQFEEKLWFMLK